MDVSRLRAEISKFVTRSSSTRRRQRSRAEWVSPRTTALDAAHRAAGERHSPPDTETCCLPQPRPSSARSCATQRRAAASHGESAACRGQVEGERPIFLISAWSPIPRIARSRKPKLMGCSKSGARDLCDGRSIGRSSPAAAKHGSASGTIALEPKSRESLLTLGGCSGRLDHASSVSIGAAHPGIGFGGRRRPVGSWLGCLLTDTLRGRIGGER